MKRVHFPDHVWECSKINEKTGQVCSRLSFRRDNFATHLQGEHGCKEQEISLLKSSCKFKVVDLFHQQWGICDEIQASRDESLENINNHFKDISESLKPPADLGASQWKERCDSDHNIQRGVHYAVGLIEDLLPAPPVISHQDLYTTDPWAIENVGTHALVREQWGLDTAETSFADLLEFSGDLDFTTALEWNREEACDVEPFLGSQFPTTCSNNPAPSQFYSSSSMETPSAPPTRITYRCHCGYEPSGEERWKASNLRRHKRIQHCQPAQTHPCKYPGCHSTFTRSDNLRCHRRDKGRFLGISSMDQKENVWS